MRHLFRLIVIILCVGLAPMFALWLLFKAPDWIWLGGGVIALLCRYPWLLLGVVVLDGFGDC